MLLQALELGGVHGITSRPTGSSEAARRHVEIADSRPRAMAAPPRSRRSASAECRWRAVRAMAPGPCSGRMRIWCLPEQPGCSATSVARDEGSAACRRGGDLDGLADQRERHRVAVGLEAHEIVAGDDAALAALQAEARLAGGGRCSCALLRGEAVDRPLVGGAVDPHIGDRGHPLRRAARRKSTLSTNSRPGRKLRLTYFTPDSTLPLVCAR